MSSPITAVTGLLAETGDVVEVTGDEVLGGEVDRPLTQWIERNLTDNELVLWAIDNALEPALQIFLIVVLASVLLLVARRAIRRAVQRARQPDDGTRNRLRQRLRFSDGQRTAHTARRAQRADALGALATSIASVVVWTIAVLMILGVFGISLGPLVAGAGIVGLALGFGAQGLVSDFISGVFMLIEDQYGVGDFIDAGEAMGTVEGVTLRSTRLRDLEGTLWHIPNGEIRRIGNMSQEYGQALLDVHVAYQTDVDLAIEVIEGVAGAMAEEPDYQAQFLDAPEVWGVQELGLDSVSVRLVIRTKAAKQWGISRELRRRLKAAFVSAGIEIPYAQRTVWLRQDDDKSSVALDVTQRTADLDAAIASARRGDRGADRVLAQDAQTVGPDAPEELEEGAED